MTVSVARWSATHPWRAIAAWLVFVAVCIAAGALTGTNLASSEDYRVGEAGRAETLAANGGVADPIVEKVLITSRDGGLDATAAASAAADVTGRLRGLREVSEVADPVTSPGAEAVMVQVTLEADENTAVDRVGALREQTAATQAAFPGLVVAQTGPTSIDKGIEEQLSEDLAFAEKLTLPITLLIMLVVFGSIIAAGVPVLLGLSSVITAMGLGAVASQVFPDAGATQNVILLLGMAVGVDYSLFYLKREREERARSNGTIDHVTAVELAAATSGHAIVVSGFAVIVSMAALYLVGDVVFSSLATGSVLVVLVAVVSSLTVLPALLAKLGRWVDRPRVPLIGRLTAKEGAGRVWPFLLRPAMRHPKATLAVSLVLMFGLAVPALDLKLSLPGNDGLPKDVAEMQTYDRMTELFPAERAQHVIVVHADSGRSAEVAAAMADLTARTGQDPLYANSSAPRVVTSQDGTVTKVRIGIPHTVEAPEALQSLRLLRDRIVPETVGRVPGAEVAVTGDVARNVDTVEHQMSRLPWVVGFVLLITFLVMVAAFGSVVVALIAVLLNLLAAATTFGVLVLVFQYGFGESLLDFTSGGFIVSRVPLFLFVILFGLSMDYHVFVVSRIKEAVVRGKTTREAVHEGITTSAGVVTSAALVMVSVFASFVFTSLLEMKQLGFGLAVAVLLDAFVIRIMILPALLTLLGKSAWWPAKPWRRKNSDVPVGQRVSPPSVRVGG